MKLLNFSNVEFKWEEEKEIYFDEYFVAIQFKYWFGYPESVYFRNFTNNEMRKKYYHFNFIKPFKWLKEVPIRFSIYFNDIKKGSSLLVELPIF